MMDTSKTKGNLSSERNRLFELLLKKIRIILPSALTIPKREVASPCLLSYAQMEIWSREQAAPGSPALIRTAAIRLTGEVDEDALRSSLFSIIDRHEVLRTSFPVKDGLPLQAISSSVDFRLNVVDISALHSSKQQSEALRLANLDARRGFDLSSGPLFRALLFRFSQNHRLLVISLHHIISDAWSIAILFRDLAAFYNSALDGIPTALDLLPVHYADYAIWQRQALSGDSFDLSLAFWRDKLASDFLPFEVQPDHPRPHSPSHRGARLSSSFSDKLCSAVKCLAKREALTDYMVMVAALNVLLSRYSNQDQISIATAVANRNLWELESSIGMFANTLVLKMDLSGNPTMKDVLMRAKQVVIESLEHQHVPYEKVIEEVRAERDASRDEMLGVMFVMQNSVDVKLEMSGVEVEEVEIEGGAAKFDLKFEVKEREGKFSSEIEYDRDLYEEETIERMMRHFEKVLEIVVTDPNLKLWDFSLLTEAESEKALKIWNDTATVENVALSVHQLFESQVEKTPDAIAVVSDGKEFTYSELNYRANQVAHHLRSLNVRAESLVGICMERSLDMIVGLLGILKAGGSYLPLDATYPKERLRLMLEDARVSALVTDQGSLEVLPEFGAVVVCLDTDWDEISKRPGYNPGNEADIDNLAYVIYTSGSTGRPKGICLPHRALTNLIEWHRESLSCGARVLQFASLSFDASFHEIFCALATGGTLYMIVDDLRLDTQKLSDFLAENEIEKLILPVVVLQQIAEEYSHAKKYLPRLKEIITTGEQLQITRPIVEFFKEMEGCSLHNHYGPSESHVVTAFTLGNEVDSWPTHPSIGKPIHNTQIYLLDHHFNPVPIGARGELYIGGVSLARGYVNRPDLTGERFIPDPFCDSPGARLYRTGDLARYLPDGSIEFLGRRDHQVKIRGFRVELGEVESVLIQHPEVREAIVVVREDTPGNKRLVAYVVADRENRPSVNGLRAYLKEKMPEYLVPSAYVIMDNLPLTPNGKVDRAALEVPCQPRVDVDSELVLPRTPAEELVARVWNSVLGVEKIGIYTNFFHLGGHSLLATQIIFQLRKIFRIDLPLRSMFEMPTIDGQVNAMAQIWGGRETVEEIAWTYMQLEQLSDADVEKMMGRHTSYSLEQGIA